MVHPISVWNDSNEWKDLAGKGFWMFMVQGPSVKWEEYFHVLQ